MTLMLNRFAIVLLFLMTPLHLFSAGSYDLGAAPVHTNGTLLKTSLWQPNTSGELEPAPVICASEETLRSFDGLLPLSALPDGALESDLGACIIEAVSSVLKEPVFAPKLDAVSLFQDIDKNANSRVTCITIITIKTERSMARACSITPKEKANWSESDLKSGPFGRYTDCVRMLPVCASPPRKEPFKVQLTVALASQDVAEPEEKHNHDISANVTYHYGTGFITVEMQYTLIKRFS